MRLSLVGSVMCIRDSQCLAGMPLLHKDTLELPGYLPPDLAGEAPEALQLAVSTLSLSSLLLLQLLLLLLPLLHRSCCHWPRSLIPL